MEEQEENLLKTDVLPKTSWHSILLPAGVILLIIFAGLGTGYFLARSGGTKSSQGLRIIKGSGGMIQKPKEAGIKDEKVFRDTAEGRLEINDHSLVEEGSHKLVRPGGESQTAYLTSSVVDLSQFEGRCVKVWGETFAGQKAGWLMDVGRIKTLAKCPEGI